MIISAISRGKRKVNPGVVHASGAPLPRRLTLALVRCQTVITRAERLVPTGSQRRGQGEIRELPRSHVEGTGLVGRPALLWLGTSSWRAQEAPGCDRTVKSWSSRNSNIVYTRVLRMVVNADARRDGTMLQVGGTY